VQQAFLSRVEEVCGPRRPSRSRYKTAPASATWSPSSRRSTASCQIFARPRRLQRSPPGHEPSIGARDGGLQAMTGSPTGRDGRFGPVREGSNKLLPGAPNFLFGSCESSARLSHIGSGTCVPLSDPAPVPVPSPASVTSRRRGCSPPGFPYAPWPAAWGTRTPPPHSTCTAPLDRGIGPGGRDGPWRSSGQRGQGSDLAAVPGCQPYGERRRGPADEWNEASTAAPGGAASARGQ
jgi:hypothetical protein